MIYYAVKKTKNPKGTEGVDYFHAQTVKVGEYRFEELADDITESTTCTAADVLAVLRSMKRFIIKALLAGQVVVLKDIGRFQVLLNGKCYPQATMAAAGFSPAAQITGHHVNFRPEVQLKNAVKEGLSLSRVASDALA